MTAAVLAGWILSLSVLRDRSSAPSAGAYLRDEARPRIPLPLFPQGGIDAVENSDPVFPWWKHKDVSMGLGGFQVGIRRGVWGRVMGVS